VYDRSPSVRRAVPSGAGRHTDEIAESRDIMPNTFAKLPYLPEMREEDAPAAIARIYADIKRASGTSLVNLIYRHLATIPGGLEWVWGCTRMNWGYDGLLNAASAMPSAEIVIRLPVALWRTVGLSEQNLGEIRTLIDHYNLTNAANILGVTALSRIIRDRRHSSGDTTLAWAEAPHRQFAAAGPPVPKLDFLPPDVIELLHFLNGIGEDEPPAMVASLFRHLTLWPGSLAVAAALLAPLSQSGELARLRRETTVAAEAIADRMISPAKLDCPPPPEATREAILHALDLFRTTLIAKMLPIGRILSQALKSA
jgi:hypothetical protein